MSGQMAEPIWHDIRKEFPDDDQKVLAINANGDMYIGVVYMYNLRYYCEQEDSDYIGSDITHWMYLPAKPKEPPVIGIDSFRRKMQIISCKCAESEKIEQKYEAIHDANVLKDAVLRRLGYGAGLDVYDRMVRNLPQ